MDPQRRGDLDRFRFDIVDVGDDGADLVVHARFRNGKRYCCYDPVCNFRSLWREWESFRVAMAEECLDHLAPVRILEWRVTVEEGAMFDLGVRESKPRIIDAPFCYRAGPYLEPEHE